MSSIPDLASPAVLEQGHHYVPHVLWVAPFVAMLLSIAVLPLVAGHWWHSNLNRFKVALVCGLPVFGLFAYHGEWHTISHTVHEYASFLILLASLYTASGGIVLRGDLKANPMTNTAFLALGSLLASFMGTTGAAMLLVRPLLKTNSQRRYKVHTAVFFVFTVCNIGGCLTPLGDPPLFLGYLRGVPFAWTFGLVYPWAFTLAVLLVLYFLIDSLFYAREDKFSLEADRSHVEPLRLQGRSNFLWLIGVVLSVAFLTGPNLAQWLGQQETDLIPRFGRDAALVLLGLGAYLTTRPENREANEFTWHPILEVAALFFGIFLSMMAAIRLLEVNGQNLPLDSPQHYFWLTGTLSAFLDNAPTYVVFFEAGAAKAKGMGITDSLVAGVPEVDLTAISLGAVFMGAVTYIGNAPNFMVKAIAEERRVKMPSFFGYMMYSLVILVPVFLVSTLIFL
ncbi:MAG: sodium:proton antiporter [Planctomycetota bacterium]|nr:MAG: sodium:proton antiporter [Planctomycetota bacterium]